MKISISIGSVGFAWFSERHIQHLLFITVQMSIIINRYVGRYLSSSRMNAAAADREWFVLRSRAWGRGRPLTRPGGRVTVILIRSDPPPAAPDLVENESAWATVGHRRNVVQGSLSLTEVVVGCGRGGGAQQYLAWHLRLFPLLYPLPDVTSLFLNHSI